jgi:formylglycine-generating enzyme required for sulfatase activity
MWSATWGCKIQRNGNSGSYIYGVDADWADRPVNYVSFWDAARFANWMGHGQPTGVQGPATTEDGSYTLNGYTGPYGSWIARNPGSTWVIPTEDEWYKAAYHKNDGVTGNYYEYPTGTDAEPSNELIDPDPGNNANFWHGGPTIGYPYYRTEVGEFENSGSPYGTLDQGGNVLEWNETVIGSSRGARGGSFDFLRNVLHATYRIHDPPSNELQNNGFRFAYVPEPATIVMLAFGGVVVLGRK